jgi:hypothetical protein
MYSGPSSVSARRVVASGRRLASRRFSNVKATAEINAIAGCNRSAAVNCKSSIAQPVLSAL